MPHHLDPYVRETGPLQRLDARAKLVATGGFVIAVLLAPASPWCPLALLAGLLLATIALARLPARLLGRRLLSLALILGLPFLLSRLGSEATRAAGEQFLVRSLLVTTAFLVLLARARAVELLEVLERLPLLSRFGQLAEFILRGVDLLVEEVVRTNRAWELRAPRATLRLRLVGLARAGISLLSRAAARSERVGAAMVLRGFQGWLPAAAPSPIPGWQLAAGAAYALAALSIAGASRWL